MAPKEKSSPTKAAAAKASPAKKQKTEDAEVEALEQKGQPKSSPAKTAKKATTARKEGKAATGLPHPTIMDILLADHRDTVALLKHFQREAAKPAADPRMLEKLCDAITIVVRLHSQAEMEVLYPLVEKELGSDGKAASQRSVEAHNKIEADLIQALELRKSGGEELNALMNEVTNAFMSHMRDEEDEIMPQLLEKLGDDQERLIDIASQFMAAKERAPLEPQPQAGTA